MMLLLTCSNMPISASMPDIVSAKKPRSALKTPSTSAAASTITSQGPFLLISSAIANSSVLVHRRIFPFDIKDLGKPSFAI